MIFLPSQTEMVERYFYYSVQYWIPRYFENVEAMSNITIRSEPKKEITL